MANQRAFTDEQSKAIIQMTNSLSELLRKRKIEHEKTDSAVLIISPTDGSKINKTSKTLSKNNITIRYDAKYFAKNPFSAGTFDEKSKTMILSHRAFKNKKLSEQILAHELVHVETFKNKQNKNPSPFYCQFKGKQFTPHLLSCDEMNAYNSDIKRFLKSGMNEKALTSKIRAAKMHTDPIPQLIENLDFGTLPKMKTASLLFKEKITKGITGLSFLIFP